MPRWIIWESNVSFSASTENQQPWFTLTYTELTHVWTWFGFFPALSAGHTGPPCSLRPGAGATLVHDVGSGLPVPEAHSCWSWMYHFHLMKDRCWACLWLGGSDKTKFTMGISGCLSDHLVSLGWNVISPRFCSIWELLLSWRVVLSADVLSCFRTVGVYNIILFLGLARNSAWPLFLPQSLWFHGACRVVQRKTQGCPNLIRALSCPGSHSKLADFCVTWWSMGYGISRTRWGLPGITLPARRWELRLRSWDSSSGTRRQGSHPCLSWSLATGCPLEGM